MKCPACGLTNPANSRIEFYEKANSIGEMKDRVERDNYMYRFEYSDIVEITNNDGDRVRDSVKYG